MASDLVAYHYRHSAFCNILHTPLRGFSATSDTPDPTTFFTLLESNDPAHIRQHWLFIHSANSLPNPIEQMSEVMDIIGPAKLTVNSYDKNIVTWAARMLADSPSKSITVDMLYEMRFRPQATSLFVPEPTDFQSPALAELQKNGFDIKESPDWFSVFKPGERSIVTLGGEKVFIVIDQATEEKAAYITLLVDPKGSDRVYVSSLETFPPWRMKGLAKRLIEHVHILHANGHFSKSKRPSRGEMWLTVFCENFGAVGMYHRLGYRVNRCLWVASCRPTS